MLLEILSQNPSGLTFSDIGIKLGMPKSSLHQLLGTLVQTNIIAYDERLKLYSLGVRLWELAMSYMNNLPVAQIVWPYLEELRGKYDRTFQIAVLDGTDVVYVGKLNSSSPLQLVSQVGSRLPAYATGIGKAMLACLSERNVRELYRNTELTAFTSRTLRDLDELINHLKLIRSQGYAKDLGEYSAEIRCVAVPLFGMGNRPVAGLSISMLGDQYTEDDENKLSDALIQVSREVSGRLGSADPTSWRNFNG